jgi:ureidoacrylate peracid hydrolase
MTGEADSGTRMVGSAVVAVDLQNDYCHPAGVFHRAGLRLGDSDAIVANVNRLTRAARSAGAPVVWVTMVWERREDLGLLAERSPFLRDEGLRRGTWGAQLLEGLDVQPGDWRVEKKRFSAFYATSLDQDLRAENVGRLFLAGVRTDFCVESTVRDAFFRDYDAIVVADAVAGYIPRFHESSLTLMGTVFARIMDTESAIALLWARGVQEQPAGAERG